MSLKDIKSVAPKSFEVQNGDEDYAAFIGSLPKSRQHKPVFAIIGTVAAALIMVVAVSIWAIIGSGVRGTLPDDTVSIPAADDDEPSSNPVTIRYFKFSTETIYSFDNADSKALKELIESFEYDQPADCSCWNVFDISFTEYDENHIGNIKNDYCIFYDADGDNIHAKNGTGLHTLTKSEQNKLSAIFSRQLIPDNHRDVSFFDTISPNITQPIEITRGKTTVTVDGDLAKNISLYFLEFRTYTDSFCKCDKVYATLKIEGKKYSFCTCDEPRLTAPCGSCVISVETMTQLCDMVDKVFTEDTQE